MNILRLSLGLPVILSMSAACTQFAPYRTETSGVALADSEDFDAQSIQRRYYGKPDQAHGDYHLAFVEFDDQGWFAKRGQMTALMELLEEIEDQEPLIYVYAHGWKHNASATDDNVICFSHLLERLDVAEQVLETNRPVVGVYVGWRGLPFDAGVLTNVSFWSRKAAASRVGRGGVFELLVRLNDFRNSRQGDGEDLDETWFANPEKTQLVITGHSFGGLVIYSALSHALMERAARVDYSGEGSRDAPARSFGDFVLLINPAFEGSLYEPLHQIAIHRENGAYQRPVMMIVTSEADSATGMAFPAGRALSTLFEHANDSAQSRSMRKTVGHDPRYQTHDLRVVAPAAEDSAASDEGSDGTAKGDDCGCPHLPTLSGWDETRVSDFIDALLAASGADGGDGSDRYGKNVRLTPVPAGKPYSEYPPGNPFLVVRTDEELIADHNAIYNEAFINFVQLFLIQNVTYRRDADAEQGGESGVAVRRPMTSEGRAASLSTP